MTPSKSGKIHVCGVTCHKGDANCNGYCHDPKVPHAKLIDPVSVTDTTIEAEIQAKGLTAPRVTPADIEKNITTEHYFTAADGVAGAVGAELYPVTDDEIGTTKTVEVIKVDSALGRLTFCVLTLRNGFTVTGESACASPENFDADVGRKVARQNAVQKIWPLMGYQLRESLAKAR